MMKYGGLSEEEALKLITMNPAWQLGIQDRLGSLDVGKDADFAIWNAHPFSVYSRVEQTFVDGEMFFDRQQDLARRDGTRTRPAASRSHRSQPPARAGRHVARTPRGASPLTVTTMTVGSAATTTNASNRPGRQDSRAGRQESA